MATGTHEYVDDPRNAEILININGEFFPRSQAKISVFDKTMRVEHQRFVNARFCSLNTGKNTVEF